MFEKYNCHPLAIPCHPPAIPYAEVVPSPLPSPCHPPPADPPPYPP